MWQREAAIDIAGGCAAEAERSYVCAHLQHHEQRPARAHLSAVTGPDTGMNEEPTKENLPKNKLLQLLKS